jgi:hypothetical protein
MLNAQNSQATEPRTDMPQIRHSCTNHSTSEPGKATKLWDIEGVTKMLDKMKPKTQFSGSSDSYTIIYFQGLHKVCQKDGKRTDGDCEKYRKRWK